VSGNRVGAALPPATGQAPPIRRRSWRGNAGSRPRRTTSAIGSSTRPRRAAPAQVRGEHPGPALFAGDVVSAGSHAWSSHDGREPALPGCVSRIVGDRPSCNRARGGPAALPGGCNGC